MERGNNLKFDSLSSRIDLRDPMAVMEREEQYSIDVDGEREGEEEERKEIMELMGEYRKGIIRNNK
jgi:hypothetical protein